MGTGVGVRATIEERAFQGLPVGGPAQAKQSHCPLDNILTRNSRCAYGAARISLSKDRDAMVAFHRVPTSSNDGWPRTPQKFDDSQGKIGAAIATTLAVMLQL